MRKKYIDGTNCRYFDNITSKTFYVDNDYKGYISLINIQKEKHKVMVGDGDSKTCLYDDGYKSIVFMPDNTHWCVEAIYDTSNNIVEWYFDITKSNLVDENGKPFFVDLYLDIVVMPNGKTLLLDEIELEGALKNNIITEQEYQLANDTAEIIMRNYITNKNFMIDFFEKYLLAFD